jgi:hypothetical protein
MARLIRDENNKVTGIEDVWDLTDVASCLEGIVEDEIPEKVLIEVLEYIERNYDCNDGLNNEVIQNAYRGVTSFFNTECEKPVFKYSELVPQLTGKHLELINKNLQACGVSPDWQERCRLLDIMFIIYLGITRSKYLENEFFNVPHVRLLTEVLVDKFSIDPIDTNRKVCIGRTINGISLNGLEYALDEDDNIKMFDTPEDCIAFLMVNGVIANVPEFMKDYDDGIYLINYVK